jgi:pyruvate dehydrogenase E1 component beta subunit
MVIPSGPRNARALLVSAIRDPDPVIFYEPKALYRAFREEVPEAEETLPLGRAQVVREGADLTLIAYGAMVRPALAAADMLLEKDGVAAEVIDLVTISPLDEETFSASVKKTGRAVIIHEAPRSFGPGAEILARLVDTVFYYLEAPVARVAGFDVVIPLFSREKAYLPSAERIVYESRKVLAAV